MILPARHLPAMLRNASFRIPELGSGREGWQGWEEQLTNGKGLLTLSKQYDTVDKKHYDDRYQGKVPGWHGW
jgi:hypothetical protein